MTKKKSNEIKAAEDCGWTDSRYWSFIRSALRRAWVKYPINHKVREDARRPYQGTDKRTKWEFQCNHCKNWFKSKDIQVDHIKPAGSLKRYEDLPAFVSTLFCSKDNLQVLCTSCHNIKTQEERKK